MTGSISQDQEPVLALLQDAASLPDVAANRIDTHANILLVGPERVYKVKRAIYYPFLDYSTLERRYRYCCAEVSLNRRTAPNLYLGIVAIYASEDGTLALGPVISEPESTLPDNAIEFAVVMARFDDEFLFDRLAERGELTAEHLQQLGDGVARFHNNAEVVIKDWATVKKEVLADNLDELSEADFWPPGMMRDHRNLCDATYDRLRAVLSDRGDGRHIRACHGDIHLRNICLIDGVVTLFDCIEFNADFSDIDVLYDLAFLLMDLEHRGMAAEANSVLNRYLERREDYSGVGLLCFYKALRAQIRAKIAVSTARFADTSAEQMVHQAEALAYFKLADQSLRRPAARLLAIGGASGSGKSTLARHLADQMAPHFGSEIIVLRSDAIRKAHWGVENEVKLPEAAYASSVSETIYGIMEDRAVQALRQGCAVILDATFTHPRSRLRVEALANELSVPFVGVFLSATPDELVRRVTERQGDVSDADARVVRHQLKQDWGRNDWIKVDTSAPDGSTYSKQEVVKTALKKTGLQESLKQG